MEHPLCLPLFLTYDKKIIRYNKFLFHAKLLCRREYGSIVDYQFEFIDNKSLNFYRCFGGNEFLNSQIYEHSNIFIFDESGLLSMLSGSALYLFYDLVERKFSNDYFRRTYENSKIMVMS